MKNVGMSQNRAMTNWFRENESKIHRDAQWCSEIGDVYYDIFIDGDFKTGAKLILVCHTRLFTFQRISHEKSL